MLHFDTDQDPWIRFVEKRTRILIEIHPKKEKIPTFLLLLIAQNYCYVIFEPIILKCSYIIK